MKRDWIQSCQYYCFAEQVFLKTGFCKWTKCLDNYFIRIMVSEGPTPNITHTAAPTVNIKLAVKMLLTAAECSVRSVVLYSFGSGCLAGLRHVGEPRTCVFYGVEVDGHAGQIIPAPKLAVSWRCNSRQKLPVGTASVMLLDELLHTRFWYVRKQSCGMNKQNKLRINVTNLTCCTL